MQSRLHNGGFVCKNTLPCGPRWAKNKRGPAGRSPSALGGLHHPHGRCGNFPQPAARAGAGLGPRSLLCGVRWWGLLSFITCASETFHSESKRNEQDLQHKTACVLSTSRDSRAQCLARTWHSRRGSQTQAGTGTGTEGAESQGQPAPSGDSGPRTAKPNFRPHSRRGRLTRREGHCPFRSHPCPLLAPREIAFGLVIRRVSQVCRKLLIQHD